MASHSISLQRFSPAGALSAALGAIVPWRPLFWAGLLAAAALSTLYVWQIVQLTGSYYHLSAQEAGITRLAEENQRLQLSFAKNSVMEQMLSKARALDFTVATSVQYIQVPENSFALK